MNRRYHLITFGCQMNSYDSEKISGILSRNGMESTSTPEEADVILLNTCSIRDKAEQKVFSKLGRLAELKKERNSTIIALGGCMATLRKEEIFRKAPMVDLLFGPDSMERIPQLIRDFRETGLRQVDVEFSPATAWDGMEGEGTVRSSKVSATVGIMKGCDNHCAYCVVPATRGPEVSRPAVSVLEEVRALAGKGYKEIVLIGQNVNSYGKGLSPDVDFPVLLKMVEKVEGIERIRFMTSHPKDLNGPLIEAIAASQKVCPAIHLPVQAGSDRILALMNRRYTAEEYLAKVMRLREAIPHIAISTDIMVGFPSETEEEFAKTLEVMEAAEFDSLFLFNYSPRPGTNAANFEGVLSREASQARFDRASDLHKRIVGRKLRALVGTVQDVLCDRVVSEETCGNTARFEGRTPANHLVFFNGPKGSEGRIMKLTMRKVLGYNLDGELP